MEQQLELEVVVEAKILIHLVQEELVAVELEGHNPIMEVLEQ